MAKKPTAKQIEAERRALHEKLAAQPPDPALAHLQGLRAYYDLDNPIGLLLDELIKDVESGAPRKTVATEAAAMLSKMDPESTAYKAVQSFLAPGGERV